MTEIELAEEANEIDRELQWAAELDKELSSRAKEFHEYLWKLGKQHELADGTRGVYLAFDLKKQWRNLLIMKRMAHEGSIENTLHIEFAVNKPEFDYQIYLQSDEWKATRDAARERAEYRCQVCNADGPILDTHHRTYERIGEELPGDLVVLCRDCHDVFHEHRKLARPQ